MYKPPFNTLKKMDGFTKVTRKEFYAKINPENVVCSIRNTSFPYTSDFKYRSGGILGVIQDLETKGSIISNYYIQNEK